MHPVEHIIYYSCVLLVLLVPMHPLAFLYNEYHASFSATGGHDGPGLHSCCLLTSHRLCVRVGFNAPGAGTDYHYLHHSKYE